MQQLFGYGTRRAHMMLDSCDTPRELFEKVSSGALTLEEREAEQWKQVFGLAELIGEETRRRHIDIITPDHADYPELLDSVYSKPLALYVKGDLSCLREHLPIAMVGTRHMSDYGEKAARELSGGLARAGCVIVSGLAVGVDSASHIGAMEAGGYTIGVMGCGLDVDYPSGSAPIKTAMKTRGAVISEYPLGMKSSRYTFPPRNRIIAGICRGTVVVEAGRHSGALITAQHALDAGRDVFAVPGSIYSSEHAGVHRLLQDGGGKLVTCVRDILEEYPEYLRFVIEMNRQPPTEVAEEDLGGLRAGSKKPAKKSSKKEQAAGPESPEAFVKPELPEDAPEQLRQVYRHLGENPRTTDVVAAHSGLEIGSVMAALTELEIMGFAQSYPGGFFSVAG
jgi:DNA processing protein